MRETFAAALQELAAAWRAHWRFLLAFALAVHVGLSVASFLDRSRIFVVDCKESRMVRC